jgi:hypothetical protein
VSGEHVELAQDDDDTVYDLSERIRKRVYDLWVKFPQADVEQASFQVNELIKDEAVWKGCRWEVSDKRSISWKAICRTKDDAQEVANALEAYARAARDEALSVCQLEPTHSAPEVLDYATGVQGSYTIRRIFEWGPSKLPTAEFWNPSGWSASGYVINDRKLADAICNLLATLPVGESPAAAPRTQNQPQREGICQDCGREYGVWFAPNEIWNLVIPNRVGMLCPVCFMMRADHAAISFTGWELRPENFSKGGRGRKDDDSSERRETSNLDNAGSSPAVPSNSSWSEMMATQLPCGHTNAEHMYYAELTCVSAAAPAAPLPPAD